MTAQAELVGFAAGALIAVVTAPVGVSGAVFLLPVQLSVLGVPSPAVTPTNLLVNVVAGPGALVRHHRQGNLTGSLTRLLAAGTLPGVVIAAVIRVFAVTGASVVRVRVGLVRRQLGWWLCVRVLRPRRRHSGRPSPRFITAMALAVGTVAGVHAIGGCSIVCPVLVAPGMPVAQV